MLIHATLLALLSAAAALDVVRYRIPNWISVALAVLFVVAGLVSKDATPWLHHLAAGLLTLLAGLVLFGLRVMGGGDAKLLAATSLWLGLDVLLRHVALTAALGVGVTMLILCARQAVPLLVAYGGLPPRWAASLPVSLTPGGAIPYGVAIAASAAYLSFEESGHLSVL